MFTILADALFAATRRTKDPVKDDWDQRFRTEKRGRGAHDLRRFNPYRDLW